MHPRVYPTQLRPGSLQRLYLPPFEPMQPHPIEANAALAADLTLALPMDAEHPTKPERCLKGLGSPLPHPHRDWGSPLPHLLRDLGARGHRTP